jgi:hypothetical protein
MQRIIVHAQSPSKPLNATCFLKCIKLFIVHSAAHHKTVYALHIYLNGVAAKAFSGDCAFQYTLAIF